ncbi:MAG TPA: antibiotic biosynthesis monooxygenase [Chloroflexota bacterium]|nr:antibiotic biosynthesis monooxygenase [Chloroflexota bacterium]
MSVLVAFIREAQPGRVAEVRAALQHHASVATQTCEGIRAYQVLQGRAQSNLYVDLVEWQSREAFEAARERLRATATDIGHLFLRPARVRVFRPLEVLRVQPREATAVGVGLVRARPGLGDYYAALLRQRVREQYPSRPGLLAVGIYQVEDAAEQFLVRTAWDHEQALLAYRAWVAREVFPTTDHLVARRELLNLLARWHYREAPLACPALV